MIVNKKRESILVFCVLFLFLTINIYTSSRSPTIWNDEVGYSDPSINFVVNGNFTSTAWSAQGPDEVWAGNVPLHQFSLIGWLSLFGISPTSVRSVNYFFVVVGVLLIWVVLRRKNLSNPALRIAAVLLVLCGEGISDSYRSGRPDMIGFLLVSMGTLGFLIPKKSRQILLASVGALFPWAGIQFLPYVSLLCGFIFFWNRKLFLETSLPVAGGGIVGAFSLFLFYKLNSVLDDFLQSVFPHVSGEPANTFSGLQIYFGDKSYLVLLLVAIFLLVYNLFEDISSRRVHPIFAYGLSVGLITPPLLYMLGKYPLYYGWMAYLPLVVGVCVEASSIRWNQWKSWIGVGLIGAASIWLPARVGVTILQWEERSYEPVESLARRTISKQDTVYSSYQSYYGAKKNASVVYLPPSLREGRQRSDEEKIQVRSIDKAIIDPRKAEKLLSELGGEWEQLAEVGENAKRKEIFGRKLAEPYRLATYARLSSEK